MLQRHSPEVPQQERRAERAPISNPEGWLRDYNSNNHMPSENKKW
jgi:hypothetical protein